MSAGKSQILVKDDLTVIFTDGEGEEQQRVTGHLTAHEAFRVAILLCEKAKAFKPWGGSPAADFCEAAATAAIGDLRDLVSAIEGTLT